MLDASFIVLVGFLVFMTTALWFGYRKSLNLLDAKIDEVKGTLDLAKANKQTAILALKEQHNHRQVIDRDIKELDQRTATQIEELNKAMALEIDRLIANRQQTFEVLIERTRNAAIDQLNSTITELATQKLTKLINELPKETHQEINTLQIQELEKLMSNGNNGNGNSAVKKSLKENVA